MLNYFLGNRLLAGYDFVFDGVRTTRPNYRGQMGQLSVFEDGKPVPYLLRNVSIQCSAR